MAVRTRYKTPVFKAIHQSASAMFKLGGMTGAEMTEFDESCLERSERFTSGEIKALREMQRVSQPAFARYLNTSVSTVQKWESGAKRPSGMAVRLLQVVRQHGLKVLEMRKTHEDNPALREDKANAAERSKVA